VIDREWFNQEHMDCCAPRAAGGHAGVLSVDRAAHQLDVGGAVFIAAALLLMARSAAS
jgi:hypothetical protein